MSNIEMAAKTELPLVWINYYGNLKHFGRVTPPSFSPNNGAGEYIDCAICGIHQ